jgi:NAD+ synthase (glutamine-hydrolysing)
MLMKRMLIPELRLRGYFTKYDCSSADLNPIGGICKLDLRKFIHHMSDFYHFDFLKEFLDAQPTAELEPRTENYVQTDEADMGMSYEELSVFGSLRKTQKMGPFTMFKRLLNDWSPEKSPREVISRF